MATFNGARFIEAQVESILRELRPGDELVISDDGSTDATVDKIRSFSDARVRVLASNGLGVAPNFEHALRHAGGGYIFLSDQDDVWLPGKLDAMCETLTRNVIAVSDCKLVDERLGVLHRSYFELIDSRPGFFRNFLRNSYLGCCMAFKRELLDVALPIPGGVAHDYWIGMVGELIGHPAFVPRPLVLYRRHLRAASSAGFKSRRSLRARVATRWTLATELVKRLPKIMNLRLGR
jgi:glycosyltransferase involved in cell wall biosynthesis